MAKFEPQRETTGMVRLEPLTTLVNLSCGATAQGSGISGIRVRTLSFTRYLKHQTPRPPSADRASNGKE